MKDLKYIFYGTGPLAEAALYSLYHAGLIPVAIVTKPDSPIGRHQTMTEPIIKTWSKSKDILILQPTSLKDENNILNIFFKENKIDLSIVASYGKIIPESLLSIPKYGTLNIHPSMLPLYRGPSPIESQLLDGATSIGLSIMALDAGMDSGPVYVQTQIPTPIGDWNTETLERICGRAGAELIVQILIFIIEGTLKPIAQDHDKATFCKFIKKEQGEIQYPIDVSELKKKWHALRPWPGIFFFIKHADKEMRVKINNIDTATSTVLRVTPEGKKEMDWESFERGYCAVT